MISIRDLCPRCNALEVLEDFPTANQGPTTRKYECGSEWYDDFQVYPCGHKPFELPKVTEEARKVIKEALSKLSVKYRT